VAQTAPLWLVLFTVAVYCGFLVGFGETVFDAPEGSCSSVTNCASSFFGFLGDFLQFITLGGFDSPLPTLIQGPLLLFFGIAWSIIIVGMITEAVGAVIP